MLTSNFNIKNLSVADAILGIKITRTSNCLVFSKSHYIKKVFKKFGRFDESPMRILVDVREYFYGKTTGRQ